MVRCIYMYFISVAQKTPLEIKYNGNGTILNDENIILASSNKNRVVTIDHNNLYEPSTLETGRIKNSYSKIDTNCRSVTSLIGNEETKSSLFLQKHRNMHNTPMGGKTRSAISFKKVVNPQSSKTDKRSNGYLVPWSSNIRTLPKQYTRYSRATSKKQLALAYKSIPKETILSRRNIGTRRANNSRKTRMPPSFHDNHKDDEALCMILKQFNSQSEGKFPDVRPSTVSKVKSKFKNMNKHSNKHVSISE